MTKRLKAWIEAATILSRQLFWGMGSMSDSARRTGPAVETHSQFLMWLIPTVEKFPRTQKFLLGDRIQTTALNVFECLI